MSLLVAGATGAIGQRVVFEALRREEFTRVVALTRSRSLEDPATLFGLACETMNGEGEVREPTLHLSEEQLSRLHPVTFDWEDFCHFWERKRVRCDNAIEGKNESRSRRDETEKHYAGILSGHSYVAMCLGTTRHDAGSANQFKRCDYDYVVAFAQAVQVFSSNSLRCYAQVSAQLANENSWFLYPQTKGRADAAVEKLQFRPLSIYRPGLLDRGEKTRMVERIAKWFVKSLPVETCGRAIIRDFLHCTNVDPTGRQPNACYGSCCGREPVNASNPHAVYYFGNKEIIEESRGCKKEEVIPYFVAVGSKNVNCRRSTAHKCVYFFHSCN